MPSKSKAKGNGYEREFVNWLADRGYSAERAWGSDGRSRGWAESVDVRVSFSDGEFNDWANDTRLQLKRRRKIAKYLEIPEGCNAVVFREDHGESLVLVRAADLWPDTRPQTKR